MKALIVGLSGYPGSGKNHMAAVLRVHYGFLPVTLALPFKLEAVAKGWPFDQVLGNEPKSPKVRRYLQRKGTEEGRDVFGEDWWVNHADAFIRYYATFGFSRFVFTDVRFPNEAAYVKQNGGLLVHLLGGTTPDDPGNQHSSESHYDSLDFEFILDNTNRDRFAEMELIRWVYPHVFPPSTAERPF